MWVTGHHTYEARPADVYALFTDREALLFATPGLESLEETSPGQYTAVLKVGIGGFALVYRGNLTLADCEPGRGYRLHVDAVTHNGFGRADAVFRFRDAEAGRTRVEFEADVELGGAQKLLPSLARGLVDFFMRGMAEALAERAQRDLHKYAF